MDKNAKNLVVFTDLDGSFLDHETYDYSAAKDALKRLDLHNIPLIPVTSKTVAEIKSLSYDFGFVPMVGENGMVSDVPDGYFGASEPINPDKSYDYIRQVVKEFPAELRRSFTGFGDMSAQQVAACTGLPEEKAALAKVRSASEPFLWDGDAKSLFKLKEIFAEKGLSVTRGGRFYHVMGQGGKDQAVSDLIKKFAEAWNTDDIISVSFGDGPNDAKMLSVTSYGVKIPNAHGTDFDVINPRGRILVAKQEGPTGWNEEMHNILDELGFSR